MQDHAKHIHHYETDTRSLQKKNTDVKRLNFFVLFFLSIAAFDIRCFGMLKFQSTSHVLLFSTSTIFYFVLVSIEYLIHF
jgi:hypothetical protein